MKYLIAEYEYGKYPVKWICGDRDGLWYWGSRSAAIPFDSERQASIFWEGARRGVPSLLDIRIVLIEEA